MGFNLQSPSSTPIKPLRLEGDWYVRHSTRAIWHGKRNVQVNGSHDKRTLPSETLLYSYQERADPEVKTRLEECCKLLGQGKDGKLESWMRETEWGIEDSSGMSFTIFSRNISLVPRRAIRRFCDWDSNFICLQARFVPTGALGGR
jgi:hypothetical protein